MIYFFFFKQKTAYERRISDGSSDVCSSDLVRRLPMATSTYRPSTIRDGAKLAASNMRITGPPDTVRGVAEALFRIGIAWGGRGNQLRSAHDTGTTLAPSRTTVPPILPPFPPRFAHLHNWYRYYDGASV